MPATSFLDYFSDLPDPRTGSNTLYSLEEILFTTLCAVICGADGWADIELFGNSKILFLRKFFPYKRGIPSDDTFRRLFRALDPDMFKQCFLAWVNHLHISMDTGVIAIDGKTSRRSHDPSQKALHLVSAFASESRMVLGQQKTDEKSNEITAIPALLELLDIQGATISIDAMGCQKEIANAIQDKGGQYLLSLKGNQSTLHEDIQLFFQDSFLSQDTQFYEDTDAGHGRIEVRKCWVSDQIEWLKARHDWNGLRSIVRVDSQVEKKGKTSCETRYYITSLPANPEHISRSVRSHWSIENSLHWVLDMSFGDDQSRIRKGYAPHNIATIRHITLNMIRKAQKKRQSIKGLRKKAGWHDETLYYILNQKST